MKRDSQQLALWGSLPDEPYRYTDKDYIVLSIQPEPYSRIQTGEKQYEYRRNFRAEPTIAFIYVTAPIGTITAVMQLARPIRDTPEQIGAFAERQARGNGEPVSRYLMGGSAPCAIPIVRFKEFSPIGLAELKRRFKFSPPQYFVSLNNNAALFAYLNKAALLTNIERPEDQIGLPRPTVIRLND